MAQKNWAGTIVNVVHGSRFEVWSFDGRHYLGPGTYLVRVPLRNVLLQPWPTFLPAPSQAEMSDFHAELDMMAKLGAMTMRIELDAGGSVYGHQCKLRSILAKALAA